MGLWTTALGKRESHELKEAQISAQRKEPSSNKRFAERQAPKYPSIQHFRITETAELLI